MTCPICGRQGEADHDTGYDVDSVCPVHTNKEIEEFEQEMKDLDKDPDDFCCGSEDFGGDEYFDKEHFEEILRDAK